MGSIKMSSILGALLEHCNIFTMKNLASREKFAKQPTFVNCIIQCKKLSQKEAKVHEMMKYWNMHFKQEFKCIYLIFLILGFYP